MPPPQKNTIIYFPGPNGAVPLRAVDNGDGSFTLATTGASQAGVPILTSLQPTTAGGLSVYRNLSLSAAGQVVKAGPGQLYGTIIGNKSPDIRYLKLYDKATAPTVADVPLITCPLSLESAQILSFPNGIQFLNGISIRVTNLPADNDATAPGVGDVIINVMYK